MYTKRNTTIYWHRQKHSPIRLGVYFKAGGIYQGQGNEGIAHLIEHLLLSNPLIRKLSDESFITIRAYTTKEFIYIHVVAPHDDNFLKTIWPEIARCLREPVISEKTIAQELNAIKSELANFAVDYPNTNQVILHDYLVSDSIMTESLGLVEGNPARADWTVNQLDAYIKEHLKSPSSIVFVGDIADSDKNIALLTDKFDDVTTSEETPRLRTSPIKEGVWLSDSHRNDSEEYACVGIGWSQEFRDAKAYLASSIYFSALANPKRGLYRLLREQENLVYDFTLDQDVIARKISIFSIHTFIPRGSEKQFLRIFEEYLQDRDTLRRDIQWQLEYYKRTAAQIYDGSMEIFNFYDYFQRIGMAAENYQKIISNLTVSDVLNTAGNLSTKNAALLVS